MGVTPPDDSAGAGAAIAVVTADDLLGVGRGTDILVVDDQASNLEAYERALATLGRTLVLVQSGAEALAKLAAQDFALILLDVSMPGMNGLETARQIRAQPRSAHTPILFITGIVRSDDVILDAFALGALDFIIKPVLPQVLRAKVEAQLRLRDRVQELVAHAIRLRDHAELREREVTAKAARRLEKLQEATAALAEARTPADVAAVAVRLGSEAVAASAAAMWTVRGDGALVVEGSHGIPPHYLAQWRVIPPGSPLPAAQVMQSRQPVWVENAADYAREAPEAFEQARAAGRVWAFAALPLVRADRPIALLAFTYEGEHRFTDEERRFLGALVRTCEQALERAQLYVAEAEARRIAEAANARKDEFLAMLGHELRNPLAAMVSALDSIKLREATLSRELAILDGQLSHLTHIVRDLVDVSRLTQGKITLDREAVALADAVAQSVAMARPALERHGHVLTVDVPGNLMVDADPHRLHQVLANLLINAAIYTPDRGRIEVTAEPAGSHVQLTVRDNGRGIPAELLPRLFDLFVQGERTPDRYEGGLGVGLTLVRNLTELHGGTVTAHSDGPGSGATFTVRWPVASSATPTARIPTLSPPEAGAIRVLIVDDNAEAAEMLALLVQSMGHLVRVANDGESALQIAATFAPQLALLDIGLPVMDGYELARRLRLLPSCASTRLVAVTGYGQPADRERSYDAGFERHLVKPVQLATLRSLLPTSAGQRR